MFAWMAIDRANVSGVLTSTFLKDTGITRDQANTGVSLLWLGIVLLEIPSNVSYRIITIPTSSGLLSLTRWFCIASDPTSGSPHRSLSGASSKSCSASSLAPGDGTPHACSSAWRRAASSREPSTRSRSGIRRMRSPRARPPSSSARPWRLLLAH